MKIFKLTLFLFYLPLVFIPLQAQDTTFVFPDGIKMVLKKQIHNGKEVFLIDSKQLKTINRQLKFLTNALKVHQSTTSIYQNNELAMDSINTLYAEKSSVELQNLENYKKAYEDLKVVITKYQRQLSLCSNDLNNCATDLKRSRNKRHMNTIKGLAGGLAIGILIGILVAK